jgi:hypothetical protein
MVVTRSMGMASGTFTHTFPLVLGALSTNVSSIAGGLTISLTGAGFGEGVGNTTVLVGGVNATVMSSSPSGLVFITPPLASAPTGPVVADLVVTVAAPDPRMRMPAFGSSRRTRALQRLSRLDKHAPSLVPRHLFKLVGVMV